MLNGHDGKIEMFLHHIPTYTSLHTKKDQGSFLGLISFLCLRRRTGPQWGECNARQTYEPKTGGGGGGHQPAKLAGESNPAQNKNSYNKLLTDTKLTDIYFYGHQQPLSGSQK